MQQVLLHLGGAPPCTRWSEQELLVFACSVLWVEQNRLSVREDLQVVSYQEAPGHYVYVCFKDNGEVEVYRPRCFKQNPRRVPC